MLINTSAQPRCQRPLTIFTKLELSAPVSHPHFVLASSSQHVCWRFLTRPRSRWHGFRQSTGSMGTMSRTLDPPPLYRPRNARASPLYQLLETYYEDVKAIWEERFEKNSVSGEASSTPWSLVT